MHPGKNGGRNATNKIITDNQIALCKDECIILFNSAGKIELNNDVIKL